jgi:1-aminocyclopropane-1-carboxylate deaminase/D-cysteine desulfhydrase-like pyridoxal-dependent ACC family enzyme
MCNLRGRSPGSQVGGNKSRKSEWLMMESAANGSTKMRDEN